MRKYNSFKLWVVSLFMVVSGALYAQEPIFSGEKAPEHQVVLFSDTTLVRNIGWVRAPFFDNWYAQLEPFGGMVYWGQEDSKAPFFDRMVWQGQANLGRWVFPMVGYRAGLGWGYGRGFVTKDTYNQLGPGSCNVGWGESGTLNGNGLGGYYYDYNDELLIQKWKYFFLSADLMVNLSYRKSYNPYRPFMTMLYAGAGAYWGLCEGYEGPGFNGAPVRVEASVDPNRSIEVHGGIIEQYQFNDRWRVYADFRLTLMQRTFDREWIKAIEHPLGVADVMTSLHIGVQYNFHWRKEAQRKKWYNETLNEYYRGEKVPYFTLATQTVRYANYMDTLFYYDTVNNEAAWRAKIRAIDGILANKDRIDDSTTLDDILSKNMLPYEMVFFELDKWDILSSENLKIAKMASIIKAFPNYKFSLIGSADSKTGTIRRNDFLSHQRADVVYNKLVKDYGIDPKQLERVYLGGILDYQPYQLNRATVIIMQHDKVLEEFNKLKKQGQAGGAQVNW